MKWLLEVNDEPIDLMRPVIGRIQKDNGSLTPKMMYTYEEIISILTTSSSMEYTNIFKETELLPSNTIKSINNECYTSLSILIDKKMWDIKYGDSNNMFYTGFPRMIFRMVLKKEDLYSVVELSVVALKDGDVINNDTTLYMFPFTNVYDDGKVCIDLQGIKLKSISDAHRVVQYFMDAPFNEDLQMHISTKKNAQITFSTYLIENDDKEFNDDKLIPLNIKLNEF